MPRTKVRECTDGCGGVMKLANVADGIPLWKCRNCNAKDQDAGTYNSNVYSFERDNPDPNGAYTPFAPDDPPQEMQWNEFLDDYAEHVEPLV